MSIRSILERLRRAEREIDEAKLELAAEAPSVAQTKEARELRLRLDRLEKQVSIIKGDHP